MSVISRSGVPAGLAMLAGTALLLAALAAACAAPVATPSPAAPTPAPAAHWSYEGEEGPDHWAELSPDYELCATGDEQSPIDITDAQLRDLPNITFDYRPAPLEIVNNGHTVQVNYPAGSGIELEGTRYELLQFHFHAPSEHHVGGRAAEAELHLVHRSADGDLAVVGVLIVEGHHGDPAMAPLTPHLPTEPGPPQSVPDAQVDAGGLLPERHTTYRYIGSLTTPPCSEGVQWLLMTEPLGLRAVHIEALRDVLAGNARPVQPLNDRTVEEDSTP